LNFQEVLDTQLRKDDASLKEIVLRAASSLKNAGVDAFLLCANTMHKFSADVEEKTGLPVIHIADVTAKEILAKNFNLVGLLGTSVTMEETFYHDRLKKHGIDTIIPDEDDRIFISKVIYEDLTREIFESETRKKFIEIMEKLVARGAQGIILGCTEIPLLVRPGDTDILMFNTLEIHALAGARYICHF
jgi:aspartate racemase